MANPKVFVTGLAGSGTTAAMRLLQELGYYLGPASELAGKPSMEHRKGLEWEPLVKFAHRMEGWTRARAQERFHYIADPKLVAWAVDIYSKEYKENGPKDTMPEVVKVPGLEAALLPLLLVLRPNHVVYVLRDMHDYMDSASRFDSTIRDYPPALRYHDYSQYIGGHVASLEASELRYTILRYPHFGIDREYAYEKFREILKGSFSYSLVKMVFGDGWDRAIDFG